MLDLEGWSNSHSRTFSPNSFQIYKSCNEIGLFLHLCTKKILSKWVNNILDSDHLMLPGTYFQIMTHLRQFLGHKKIKYLDIAVCSKIIQMHPFIYEFFVIFQIMTHLRPFLDRKNIKWILQSAQKWNQNASLWPTVYVWPPLQI